MLLRTKPFQYYFKGKSFLNDPECKAAQQKSELELSKRPSRTEIINFLLGLCEEETLYLEIGVRNPNHNFNHIKASTKYGVDPGLEFEENPVDFKFTSDVFFQKLAAGEILSKDIRFHVIFIDGLHLAPQVDRDIKNALHYIKNDGFVVLHDCNPPTEWHARETYKFLQSPAQGYWNGTSWKAFLKWRLDPSVMSCCIDSDWGVGVISKKHPIGKNAKRDNPFFEYSLLEANRKEYLNLIDFDTFKRLVQK